MTYQWKVDGLYSVDAQTAGEELERIYQKHRELDPSDVVDESRPENAPLHPCFEWNDETAAELYRRSQAQTMIRCITTTVETDAAPVEVRAFVRAERPNYQPISIVMQSQDAMDELFKKAMEELRSFQKKYSGLKALQPVFNALDQLTT